MSAPYTVWDLHKSLTAIRGVKPVFNYFTDLAYNEREITSDNEWIDFDKLPSVARKLAPFVRPLGSGKPLYEDRSGSFRFKPAYSKIKEVIDPIAPLVKRPGIDSSMINTTTLTPNQRRDLLRAAMTVQAVNAIKRRWEWMAARSLIDAKVTIEGEEYPAVELDFRRAPNHTVVKTSGSFWGDTGISIFEDIQTYADRMVDSEFGGYPNRLTITPKAWKVMRMDPEFMKHMDTQVRDPRATIERGIIGAEKVIKVGELTVGGNSGAVIEIWLHRDTFVDPDTGLSRAFMEDGDILLSSTSEAIQGYRCFGAIIDPYANYQPLDIFARGWMEPGDPAVEYMLWQSAPLFVPLNPDATLKATVVG